MNRWTLVKLAIAWDDEMGRDPEETAAVCEDMSTAELERKLRRVYGEDFAGAYDAYGADTSTADELAVAIYGR